MTENGDFEREPHNEMQELLAEEKVSPLASQRRPRRKIRTNIILFFATFLTTLVAGALLAEVDPLARPDLIYRGLPFSITIMCILLSHELGHYLMSRYHNVDATLPYFIPAPTLIGTFGAIIKINSNVPDRRALLDIGATGPIVGFVVSIPALIIGLKLSHPVVGTSSGITFGSSLLLNVITDRLFPAIPEGYAINLHPVALAGWIGLLVTMLNLLPVGMMDGGHITYALFGKWHYHISRVVVLILFIMGIYGWFGWAIWGMLNVFFGLRHVPPTYPEIPLDTRRKLIGAVTAIILILTFVPTPFSIH